MNSAAKAAYWVLFAGYMIALIASSFFDVVIPPKELAGAALFGAGMGCLAMIRSL